jgi:hypothetical protein
LPRLSKVHAASTFEAALPVTLGHVLNTHSCARLGRMYKLAFTYVNTNMAECAFEGVEKYQIPRP